MRKFFKITNRVILILIGILLIQFGYNEYRVNQLDRPYESEHLKPEDQASLREVYKMKDHFGDSIWPGFSKQEMPVILFNDRFEFLFGTSQSPEGWEPVKDDMLMGKNYYRRPAENPQAFAVQTETGWVGSMSSLSYLNRDILLTIRDQLPIPLNRLMPSQMMVRSNDFHVVSIIHEMFHAYQARNYPEKFGRSVAQANVTEDYPYEKQRLNELFTQEGNYLVKALNAEDREVKLKWARKFIYTRNRRRKEMHIEKINYEKFTEWLEGLAKYTEIKAYEVAYDHADKLAFDYKKGLPHWKTEWNNLEKLGNVGGSSRFYLSGMAQYRLLDQLSDDWKQQIMKMGVFPETLLKKMVR